MITYAGAGSFAIAQSRTPAMHACMDSALSGELADWTLIRTFVEVVRSGTLSAASRNLGQTQPTIGRQIRKLEDICGEPLFLRRGRELEPTDRARKLHAQANALEPEITALARAFGAPALDGAGLVRITTSAVFAATVLPGLLPPILNADPGLSIEVIASDRYENLARRDADIAIRFARPTQPELIAAKLGDISVGLYAAPALIEAYWPPRGFADLAAWPWVADSDGRELLEAAQAAGVRIDPGRLRVRSDSIQVRNAAVRAGLGVGPMVCGLAERDPGLVRVLPEKTVNTLPAWIVAHDDLHRSPRMRFVFDELRTSIRRMVSDAVGEEVTPA
jgi:DNA-binding transcriptional LysR family regulator